jgi:hypothetical protein
MSRKLAGILVADAVAYSARMEENEVKALDALSNSRAIIDDVLASHQGTVRAKLLEAGRASN